MPFAHYNNVDKMNTASIFYNLDKANTESREPICTDHLNNDLSRHTFLNKMTRWNTTESLVSLTPVKLIQFLHSIRKKFLFTVKLVL